MTVPRSLVCPKCSAQATYSLSEGWTTCTCAGCKEEFDCLFAIVRAKRSRGDKKIGTRQYSVRVLVGPDEKLIEFGSRDHYDFEMRSGDEVGFLYRRGMTYIVHNFTIGRYHIINKDFNFIPMLVLAAIVVVIIVIASVAR
jgi:hypothetical protein